MIIQDTTLSASRIGLGTHSLHRLASAGARQRLLAVAHELGLSYFDTAPSYGAGIAEAELGRFLRDKRSGVVLSTKFGIPSSRLGARIPGWNYGAMAGRLVKRLLGRNRGSKLPPRDFSARRAQSSVEDSLRALQTDYIDVFHLHEPTLDLLGDAEHLARALEQLKAAGKVRYVGLSGRAAACASIARRQPRLAEVLQLEAPAGADGLPDAIEADTAAAVTFWEFAPGTAPAGLVRATVERLLAAAPQSVTLVSTNSEANLRAAVAILNNLHAAAPPSATSSLA